MAALPPDACGKVARAVAWAAVSGEAALAVLEGPRAVKWREAVQVNVEEFVTTEFGEAAARRRVCMVASADVEVQGALEGTTSRSWLAPPMNAKIQPLREVGPEQWFSPERVVVDISIPREPLLAVAKGHFCIDGVRHNLYSTGGPLKWPLRETSWRCDGVNDVGPSRT